MKNSAWMWAAITTLMIGCGPKEDHLRNLIREEIGQTQERKVIAMGKTIGPYSPAIRVGDFLYLSGQIGLDQSTGQLVSASIEEETGQVLKNIDALLQLEGYGPADVVSATVYLKHMSDFQKMNGVYAKYFQEGNYPARTTVAVSELPRQANIEIAVIACKAD